MLKKFFNFKLSQMPIMTKGFYPCAKIQPYRADHLRIANVNYYFKKKSEIFGCQDLSNRSIKSRYCVRYLYDIQK